MSESYLLQMAFQGRIGRAFKKHAPESALPLITTQALSKAEITGGGGHKALPLPLPRLDTDVNK